MEVSKPSCYEGDFGIVIVEMVACERYCSNRYRTWHATGAQNIPP